MIKSDEKIPYTQVLQVINELLRDNRNGTLFMTSEQNRMATIALRAGKIIALQMRARRGVKAIPLISEIKHVSYRFEEDNLVLRAQSDLLEISDVLSELGAELPNDDLNGESSEKLVESSAQDDIQELTDTTISEEQKNVINAVLVDLVGPLAIMAFEDLLERESGLNTILSTLIEQMPNKDIAIEFVEEVYAKLELA